MRRRRRVTLLLALAGTSAGCHRGSSGSPPVSVPAPDAPALTGTWSTGCVPDPDTPGSFITETRAFTAEAYEATFAAYGDEGCKTPLSTQVRRGGFVVGASLGGDVHALDLAVEATSLTLHTAELVKAYDEAQVCGGGWALGKTRAVERSRCKGDDTTEISGHVYDAVAVRGAALYFGRTDGAHAGLTVATRPLAVDGTKPFARL